MSIITPAVYREHDPGCALGDDALQRLIDANEAEMIRRLGPLGTHTEQFRGGHWQSYGAGKTVNTGGGQQTIMLRQRAAEVVSVRTRWAGQTAYETLAAGDYMLWDDGLTLQRLPTGPNGWDVWATEVLVEYTPQEQLSERVAAMVELVGCDVTGGVTAGMLASRTMGSWSESYNTSSGPSGKAAAKTAIYARLSPTGGVYLA